MRRRIFIAINLPEKIKNQMADFQLKWPELPCRWVKRENLHLTLAFLGYLTDEEIINVCKTAKETTLKYSPFVIKMDKIIYGPPKKPARMVWLEGEKSENLTKLQDDLAGALGIKEERDYSPHLTLGRLKQWEFQRLEPEERPEINEDISLGFEVSSIEIMESQLKRNGPIYTILES